MRDVNGIVGTTILAAPLAREALNQSSDSKKPR